jgi:hypothetical protein
MAAILKSLDPGQSAMTRPGGAQVREENASDRVIQVETTTGRPIRAAGQVIVPLARVVRLRLPLLHGGVIWNRPIAVLVRSEDGSEYEVPIHDVTRRVQLIALAAGLIGSLLIWLLLHRR